MFRSRFLGALRPPIPLLNTTAEHIVDGLLNMPALLAHRKFHGLCFAKSKLAFMSYDRDGAGANDRAIAAMLKKLPPTTCISDRLCGHLERET